MENFCLVFLQCLRVGQLCFFVFEMHLEYGGRALKDMNEDNAPDLDGFAIIFWAFNWDLVKEVMNFFKEFLKNVFCCLVFFYHFLLFPIAFDGWITSISDVW